MAARLAAMRARILEKQKVEETKVKARLAEDNVAWEAQEKAEREERAKRRAEALERKVKEDAEKEVVAKRKAEEERVAEQARGAEEQAAKKARIDAANQVPKCSCGIDSVRLTVKKPGPSCGKPFFGCQKQQGEGKCNFFKWDEPTKPLCRCGVESAGRVVKKEGPTCGKTFYSCAGPQEKRCNFFQWQEEGPSTTESATSETPTKAPTNQAQESPIKQAQTPVAGAEPKCRCGTKAARLVVKKAGPTCGKAFFKCGKQTPNDSERCKFFEWEQEPSPTAGTKDAV